MAHISRSFVVAALLSAAVGCGTAELDLSNDGPAEKVGSLPGDVEYALRALPSAEVTASHRDGVPSFVRGNLGAAKADPTAALKQLAPVFRLKEGNLVPLRTEVDALGKTHVRYQQQKNGLRVVGGDLVVHMDADGTVYAANSTARDDVPVDALPSFTADEAVAHARAVAAYGSATFTVAELVYVYSTADDALHLAWRTTAAGQSGVLPFRDELFIDAHSGELADVRPQVHTALNRRIYSANNGASLPGTLRLSEGGAASTDSQVKAAYDNTGTTWSFYKTVLGRDSYDAQGGALISTVHYGQGYDNAYWDGEQMVYGDGNGSDIGPLATALDVTAHELTHAVTERTANLAYQNEPGALNEAMSDIMGASTESWSRNNAVDSKTWQLGEDIWTPGVAGDALRYMNDPAADGQSSDYYPTRYQGSQDSGGVHLNSGIANLAFKLLVTGGTHPRNKTTVQVTGIGIEKARAIFYRALTQYMTANTNFSAARAATKQAATDLYGAAAATFVEQAWAAVGVGSAPLGSTSGGTSTSSGSVTTLANNVPVTGLSGAANAELVFTFKVPAGAANLSFRMSGNSGDADLYVKLGSKPTTTSYDYRPYLEGSNEAVAASAATAGTWYVAVRGYSAFSGLSLVAAYDAASSSGTASNVLQSGVAVSGLSGAAGSSRVFTFVAPAGATQLSFALSGGTGDADLYVRFGAAPTTATFDFRPFLEGNDEAVTAPSKPGTWYVMVRGYAAFSGASLVATAK